MSDLMDELRKSRRPSSKSVDAFEAAGVSPLALYFDADEVPNPIGVDRVLFGFHGRFEFERYGKDTAGEGCQAFVIGARDDRGMLVDIVAWTPKRPPGHNLALWLGALPMLGMEQLFSNRWELNALPVQPDMDSWLRLGRRGVVIFDYYAAAPLLHQSAPLLVADPVHARWLRDCLTIPPPKIMVGEIPV